MNTDGEFPSYSSLRDDDPIPQLTEQDVARALQQGAASARELQRSLDEATRVPAETWNFRLR